mgnify:FL=1
MYKYDHLIYGLIRKINKIKNYLFVKFPFAISSPPEELGINQKIKETIGNFDLLDKRFFNEKDLNKILDKANQIIDNKYDILGYKKNKIKKINWHKDFISGYEWKKGIPYHKYKFLDYSINYDVKIPWELSRCHHLLYLGQSYLLTKNDKYSKKIIYDINDWIDNNPFLYSINWKCAMDVSIRSINWIYAYNMISSIDVDQKFKIKFKKSLYEHGWYIYRNLEDNFKNSTNHYVSNLVGLLLLGLIFNNCKEGKKWISYAIINIHKNILNQTYSSGVNYEKSINYHRLVTEMFTLCYILLKKHNYIIPNDVKKRVEKQFDFIMAYTKPNDNSPIIGDQDDGRLLPFGIQKNINHSYLLTIGSILFDRNDFKSLSSGYNVDAFFFLGDNSIDIYKNIRKVKLEYKSSAFEDAGFFIMKNNKDYIFINNSGLGLNAYKDNHNGGTHTHADMLSFELCIDNEDIIVDTGSYEYTRDIKTRNYFRSTKMHNTIEVDEKDQYEIDYDRFSKFKTRAKPKHIKWESNNDYDLYIGEHNGYARLEDPFIHRREFKYLKNKRELFITDQLISNESHNIKSYFHFKPGLDVEIKDNFITVYCKKKKVILSFVNIEKINLKKYKDWVSSSYGSKKMGNVICLAFKSVPNQNFQTKFFVEDYS